MRGMCSERVTTTWSASASAATIPPSYPTIAIVRSPRRRASARAAITLAELPLVDSASTASPGQSRKTQPRQLARPDSAFQQSLELLERRLRLALGHSPHQRPRRSGAQRPHRRSELVLVVESRAAVVLRQPVHGLGPRTRRPPTLPARQALGFQLRHLPLDLEGHAAHAQRLLK